MDKDTGDETTFFDRLLGSVDDGNDRTYQRNAVQPARIQTVHGRECRVMDDGTCYLPKLDGWRNVGRLTK